MGAPYVLLCRQHEPWWKQRHKVNGADVPSVVASVPPQSAFMVCYLTFPAPGGWRSSLCMVTGYFFPQLKEGQN